VTPGRSWRWLWTDRRAGLWLTATALASWLPLLGMPSRRWLDFDAFYVAGTLAFSPRVVDLGPALEYQLSHGLPLTPFLYPPALALVYVPFTWLPFDLAAALHVLLQGAALIGAAILCARVYGIPRRWAVLGALAWGPAAAGVVSGQNSAVLLLLVVAAPPGSRGAGGSSPASRSAAQPTVRTWDSRSARWRPGVARGVPSPSRSASWPSSTCWASWRRGAPGTGRPGGWPAWAPRRRRTSGRSVGRR